MVKEREEELMTVENEHRVDSVQERFPNDNLQLQEKEKVSRSTFILVYLFVSL